MSGPVTFVMVDDTLILRVQGAIPCWGGVWLEPHHFGWENKMQPIPYEHDDEEPEEFSSAPLDVLPARRPATFMAAIVVIGVVFVLGCALGALTVLALN